MRALSILAALLLAPLTDAVSQKPPTLTPRQRVRITAPVVGLHEEQAVFQSIERGVLVVSVDTTLRIHLALLERLEAQAGRKSHWGTGAVVGGVLGGAGGAMAVVAVCTGFAAPGYDCRSDVALGFVGGALGGAVVGMVIGAAIRTDKWEEVPLSRLRVSLAPQRNGRLGFGLEVRF